MAALPPVHIIIPTHTTRHLAACLRGLARQTVRPVSVVVSCDTDDPAIGVLLERAELPACRVVLVGRKHQGWPHPAQVRNNAVRALDAAGVLQDRDLLLGIDGDIVLCAGAVQEHSKLAGAGAELIIAFRMCLDEASTEQFSRGDIDEPATLVSVPEFEALARRDQRYQKQLAMRQIPVAGRFLVKSHKPKLISAHYAVTVGRFREVNGFDEEYTHYGYEDDDLGRRLHAVGARCAIGVAAIPAVHLWHPSRAPASPTEAPGYQRFCLKLPNRAAQGLQNGKPQPEVTVRTIRG